VTIFEFHPGDTKYIEKESKYQHNVSLNLSLEVKKQRTKTHK